MSKSKEFSKNVIDKLGYYVYIYSDPDTKEPFYIGKGKANRCFSHLFLDGESEKIQKIDEIRKKGKEPTIEILIHGVDEETALKVEAAAIDLIGIEQLTNIQKGHHASVYGRIDVDELNARYNQKMLCREDVKHNVMMIRINNTYRYGMSDFDLYEATRACWKINKDQADKVEYVFAIYDGMIMEAYEVVMWLPAYSIMHKEKQPLEVMERDKGRYEFVGKPAEENIRKMYVGKMVNNLFPHGNQNPIKYFFKEE